MIKLLSILTFSLILSGCWTQDPEDNNKNNAQNVNDDSVMGQIGDNVLPIEGQGSNMTISSLNELSHAQLRAMGRITIPVFQAATLEIIPFPDEVGYIEPATSVFGIGDSYCANDFLVGELLVLNGDWWITKEGSCVPSGEAKTMQVDAEDLIEWRLKYNRGAPTE